MFWPFPMDQTTTTHILSPLWWCRVLTDSIWTPFYPWEMLYQRPQVCSTPGKLVLLQIPVKTVHGKSTQSLRAVSPSQSDWA